MWLLRRFTLIVLIYFASGLYAANELTSERAIGEAYDIKTGDLLYTETHQKPSKYVHLVTYREVTGDVFAEKSLNYANSFLMPSFEQKNQRNGEVISVVVSDKGDLNVTYKAAENRQPKTKNIEVKDRLILDAGFDHFVRLNWQSLTSGNTMKVDFLEPTRQMTVTFRIKKTDCKENEVEAVCLLLSPNSWLLSAILDPIYLVYHAQSQKLQRYLGRGNISEKNGDYLSVDIRYRYESATKEGANKSRYDALSSS